MSTARPSVRDPWRRAGAKRTRYLQLMDAIDARLTALGITLQSATKEMNLTYEREADTAIAAVDSGRAQVSFFLNPVDARARVNKDFREFYERLRILRRERDGGMEGLLMAMATGYDYRKYQKVKALEKKGSH